MPKGFTVTCDVADIKISQCDNCVFGLAGSSTVSSEDLVHWEHGTQLFGVSNDNSGA